MKTCDYCDKPVKSSGMCGTHYMQERNRYLRSMNRCTYCGGKNDRERNFCTSCAADYNAKLKMRREQKKHGRLSV